MPNLEDLARGRDRNPDQILSDVMDLDDPTENSNEHRALASNRNTNPLGRDRTEIQNYISSHSNDSRGSDIQDNVDIDDIESEQTDTQEAESSTTSSDTSESSHNKPITFFQSIILMGIAACILYLPARYALESIQEINVNKIQADVKENTYKIMGRDVTETENDVHQLVEGIMAGTYLTEQITSYKVDKKGNVTFETEYFSYNGPASNFPEFNFKKEGYLILELTHDANTNNVISYEIKDVEEGAAE